MAQGSAVAEDAPPAVADEGTSVVAEEGTSAVAEEGTSAVADEQPPISGGSHGRIQAWQQQQAAIREQFQNRKD